jgi:hypothetical protein
VRDVEDARWSAERFAPEAIVVRLPEWRQLPDGSGEMRVRGAWEPIHPIFVRALDTMASGGTYRAAYEAASLVRGPEITENALNVLLRRFYWKLHKLGHVRIPFEEPPALFHGRYRRVRELGRGGIGIAHLCVDEKDGERVVVKHAWGYFAHPKHTDQGMRREGEILRALDHPGFARFLDEFEESGLYHLVREFGDGRPLSEAFSRREPRPAPEDARRTLLDVAAIIAHVHERGYLFLDATPGNFILRADGSPLVIDAGVCQRPDADGRLALRGAIGSRGYIAPELFTEPRHAEIRSDVYALGSLFQYLLTGGTPGNRLTTAQRAEHLARKGVAAPDAEVVLRLTRDAIHERPAGMLEAASLIRGSTA